MKSRTTTSFMSIRTEGSILPADLLQRIAEGTGLEGLTPEDYHLPEGEKLNEAINRSWLRALSYWRAFRSHLEKLPPEDQTATSLTRERWLLPLFQELGYGRLPAQRRSFEMDGEEFPISHLWGSTPIHLVGARLEIDRPARGIPGAARAAPHSMVQDFLNRSDEHLWAFVSNGLKLRILRDNLSLVRQAYVEFDLEAMMEGELYPDFAILWLLCHQSRVEAERPEECWLEQWSRKASEEGVRALEQLRSGVEEAIAALGRGFLAGRGNARLLERLRDGSLDKQDYYRQLLRLVYRLVFLFVAEDRDLLFAPDADLSARKRYADYFSTRRLREIARKVRGGAHPDLWDALGLLMRGLGSDEGLPELGLPALGSFLWSDEACPDLMDAVLPNRELLEAIRALSVITVAGKRRVVSYKNLRSEELGSIYEALLELHPVLNPQAAAFSLEVVSGHERKLTGSYYTPESLVQSLIETALEPVIEERLKSAREKAGKEKGGAGGEGSYARIAEAELLSIKVCDPACGSGHFLVAAAHRLARHLARVRSGSVEPPPDIVQRALRDVIGHCVYGVDINPMSVELCKFALWMEAIDPGRPLSFLDHHIKCGNSLLGATPELIAEGIPDGAFKPLEGDDKKISAGFKKRNREERNAPEQQLISFGIKEEEFSYMPLAGQAAEIGLVDDRKIAGIAEIKRRYDTLLHSPDYLKQKLVADAWCAAFAGKKTAAAPEPLTSAVLVQLQDDPESVPLSIRGEIACLAQNYNFFHWHLAFPEIFAPEHGCFDCVLGNPPWEHTELKEKEFFADIRPEIAEAPGNKRKKLIAALEKEDSELYRHFEVKKREHDLVSHFVRNSGAYPLCGCGRINTYAIFAELNRRLLGSKGMCGCILPSGIATDDTTKEFFQSLVDTGTIRSLFDFENRKKIFPAVDSRVKFCLLTMGAPDEIEGEKKEKPAPADFVFFATDVSDLKNPEKRFQLTPEEIVLLNPNTRTCPIFRFRKDAELTKYIYRRIPVLIDENKGEEGNPWGISFKQGLFNMTSDSGLFRTRDELEVEGYILQGNIFERGEEKPETQTDSESPNRYLPLYEAKMTQMYNHRAADVVVSAKARQRKAQPKTLSKLELSNPDRVAMPLYWVDEYECFKVITGIWNRLWLLGFTNVTSPTNERTMIPSLFPWSGVGNSMPVILGTKHSMDFGVLYANLCSFCFDYIVRQKIGGVNLNFYLVNQVVVLSPDTLKEMSSWDKAESIRSWMTGRLLELTYTAWDLESFARDCGYNGLPFIWNEERRFQIRCELDAAYFHLYLGTEEEWKEQGTPALQDHFPTPRHAIDYIMDTFPITRRKEEQKHGEYRTKRLTLEIYDKITESIRTGQPFQTILNPPPGPPSDEKGNFLPLPEWKPGQPKPANWPSHIHPPKGRGRRVKPRLLTDKHEKWPDRTEFRTKVAIQSAPK